jgi:glycosyltransferase involved in cell wall biosynthesis
LVSILIPAFNAAPWLGASIESALAQTWPRTEIIVVDDGSTDATAAVARAYASPRVSIVAQPRQGASAARNTALARANGDYIQWLDADDLLGPAKIARQLTADAAGRSQRTLLSCRWGSFFYRPHKARFVPTDLWCDLSPLEWLLHRIGRNLYMPIHSWLISRCLTDAAGQWDTRLSADDDGEYVSRLLLASDGTHFVPGAEAFYRRTSGRNPRTASAGAQDSQFLSNRLHIARIRSLDDGDQVRQACLAFLQRWLVYFYPERDDIVRECERLAADLGGELSPPTLPPKYAWLQRPFGWRVGKFAWDRVPRFGSAVARSWDKMLFALEQR